MLIPIIISTFIISLGGFAGVLTLTLQKDKLSKILLLLVAFSAGALMGGAFLHLLPEGLELLGSGIFPVVLFSFVFFFVVEKILHWRHCHKGECDVHTFGSMNLVGDAIHNFIDGMIIAAAFMADFRLGVTSTIAVALHEIPQEIGDFGVLLYSGFSVKKALTSNVAVAMTAVLGGVVGYYLSSFIENISSFLIPFAAGGFIYIASSDLMPEIRKEKSLRKSMSSMGLFLAGIILMAVLKIIGGE